MVSWGLLGPHKDGFGGPWRAPGRSLSSLGAPLGSLLERWDGPLESSGGSHGCVACKAEIPRGGLNTQPVLLDAYIIRGVSMVAWAMSDGSGPPLSLAKSKSAENERRYDEARVECLTRPGPKAHRVQASLPRDIKLEWICKDN